MDLEGGSIVAANILPKRLAFLLFDANKQVRAVALSLTIDEVGCEQLAELLEGAN